MNKKEEFTEYSVPIGTLSKESKAAWNMSLEETWNIDSEFMKEIRKELEAYAVKQHEKMFAEEDRKDQWWNGGTYAD